MSRHINQPIKRYMAGLDGLRAFSVLAVIAYHLNFKWAQGGLLGVEIFFVLSGYLITDQILMEWKRNHRFLLTTFWMRRMRRLLPAMILMMLAVAIWLMITDWSRLQLLTGDFVSSFFYVNNWYLIFHNVSYFESFGPASPIGHLWSLAIEEQFYVVWPILLLLGIYLIPQRGKLLLCILIGIVLSVVVMAILYQPGTDPSRVYYGTDTRAFAILIGAALAIIWPSWKLSHQISPSARNTMDIIGIFGIMILFVLVYTTNEFDDWLYPWGFLGLSLITTLVIAILVHPANRLGKIMGGKVLTWIGKRSYSLYIWHYPVIILSTPNVDTDGINYTRVVLQLVITIIISSLSYRYVEEPIRHGNFFVRPNSSGTRSNRYGQGMMITLIVSIVLLLASWGASALQPERSAAATAPVPIATVLQPVNEESTAPSSNQNESIAFPEQNSVMPTVNQQTVTAIGDSIMLDAQPYLEKEIPGIVVDGKVGRQMSQATEVIEDLRTQGKLGNTIIIELGTNGVFSKNQLRTLLASLQEQQVYLVNTRVPREWQDIVNESIREMTDEFNHVHMIDWYTISENKENWFYSDGVHLKSEGAESLSSTITNTIQSNFKN